MNKKMFSPFIKNNVLSLKKLKQTNIALFKYVKNNKKSLEKRFDIKILNDTVAVRGINNFKLYFSYYYGDTVNLTKLREGDIVMYNGICTLGTPEKVIKDMGFKTEYTTKMSEDELIRKLEDIADENKVVRRLSKKLDNVVRYKANKVNKTVREYVGELGFMLDYRGKLSKRRENIDKS